METSEGDASIRLDNIGKRCFAVFAIYFIVVIWIAFVGSSWPFLQPSFSCIVLGAAITSSLYLRAGKKSYEALSQAKAIRWYSGNAMIWGIWVMAIAGLCALMFAEDRSSF